MQKSKVFFVHGFMSGKSSSKWTYLETLQNRFAIDIIETEFKQEAPYDILEKICAAVDIEDIVVGHSLGGFFTRLAQNRLGFASLLINPSFNPVATLYRDPARSLPDIYRQDYMDLTATLGQRCGAETVLIETGDEIIDQKAQIPYFHQSALHVFQGGSHAFDRLEVIGRELERIDNKPWN